MDYITHKEAKALTGCATAAQAWQEIYSRLTRRTWTQQGKTYTPAGMTWHRADGPQSLHLTYTAPAGPGCAYHERVKLKLADALDCISGHFQQVERI